MTVYRDSSKPRKPILFCRQGTTYYIVSSRHQQLLDNIKEGKVAPPSKTIFFDNEKEMGTFILDNCKVIIYCLV